MAEQLRDQQRRGAPDQPLGEGIYNLADRLINRKKVSRKVLEEAAADVMGWWDRMQQQQPPPDPAAPADAPRRGSWEDIAARARRIAEEAARRAQQAANEARDRANARERGQRPPADPREAEERAARARARLVMGFEPDQEITADLLKARYRELAKRHHPDRGGSVAKMQELNVAMDVLTKSLVT